MRRCALLTLFLLFLALPLLLPGSGFAADPAPAAPGSAEGSANFQFPFGPEEQPVRIADPLQSFNRGVFWLNDKLYFYLFKPIARVYRVVPAPARSAVSNFFTNLATPVRLGNDLLQLRFITAGRELVRFTTNTVLGIGGLFDFADKYGHLKAPSEQDLGLTLGHYGVGNGFYLELPVLGPSTVRDGVGLIGDLFLDPQTYLLRSTVQWGLKGYDYENELSLDKDTYESIKRNSLDPYLFIRNAYAQRRAAELKK